MADIAHPLGSLGARHPVVSDRLFWGPGARGKLKIVVATFAVFAAFGITSSASPDAPWCQNLLGHCSAAEGGVEATLGSRFGDAYYEDQDALLTCPTQETYTGTAYCLAYFSDHDEHYFLSAAVSRGQAANVSAKITEITRWRRYWRTCRIISDLRSRPVPGHLESNAPSQVFPLNASNIVGAAMQTRTGQHLRYVHRVGWLTLDPDAATFVQYGMSRVAIDTCAYKASTITCSDREGNSFRYTY